MKEIIIKTVGGIGFLSVAMMAPNVLKTLNNMGVIPGSRQRDVIRESRKKLVKSGFLEYANNGMIKLTNRGEKEFLKMSLSNFNNKKNNILFIFICILIHLYREEH